MNTRSDLGGSGSVNGLIQIRVQAEGFVEWAWLGANGWVPDEALRYFLSCSNSRGALAYHCGDGPLSVTFDGRLQMRDPLHAPAMLPNFLSTGYDRQLMIEGAKLI